MLKRLDFDQKDRLLENGEWKIKSEEKQHRLVELHRQEISGVETVGAEQARLVDTKKRILVESQMWEREISYRLKWATEKKKVI